MEHGVLAEIAEREFGTDEVKLTIATNEPTRKFLVDAFGEEGDEIFEEFAGGDLPSGLSDAEVGARIRERFAQPSVRLAFYLLASMWSVQGVLQQAGATEATFMSAQRETFARVAQMFGEEKAEHIARMNFEFVTAATS